MTSNAESAKTQRRGVETKRRLVDVTKNLLAKFDYQTITLDQVASAVGVSKSSILWHFGSKEALLTEAVFDLFEEIDEKINLQKPRLGSLDQRLDYLLASVADYLANNPDAKGITISLLFNSRVPNEIHDRIRHHWDRHIEQIKEFLSTDTNPFDETSAAALMALMHGCYLQWHLRGCKGDLEAELKDAVASLRRGL